jgi:hypothetical protein
MSWQHLDHGLEDGLDADLEELSSRGREVDEALLFPPDHLRPFGG